GTGARLPLGGKSLSGRSSQGVEVDFLAGAGLAAVSDTNTTLVSLAPLLRAEARLLLPIAFGWRWSIGLPIELSQRGTAYTMMASATVGLALPPVGGK
ncbi:MAG: hypothetical protein WCL50_05355, partial [Spirochaetota bacterium]